MAFSHWWRQFDSLGRILLSHDVRTAVSGSKPLLISLEIIISTAIYEHYLFNIPRHYILAESLSGHVGFQYGDKG